MAEFKRFLEKSNALALAVGVIIGVALGAVVDSLVKDIIMPPVGYALGGIDFNSYKLVLKSATNGDPATEVAIRYGTFINLVIAFVFVAVVALLISKVFLGAPDNAPSPATKDCPYCATSILEAATRCPNCTSEL